jgi:SAM-dependent methyltransferase
VLLEFLEKVTVANSIDWARVADLYDTYVRTDLDIPFFLNQARKTTGKVLELMSGTGRVALPLIEAGVRLTCVDASAEMLAILRTKLAERNLSAPVYQMDVRALKIATRFDLIFIPFHSFAELPSPEDQRQTLARISEHLADNGRFICTLHNPRVRLKRVDGQLRSWGKYPFKDHGTLLFWGLENYDSDTHLVNGWEFFEEYDSNGILRSKRAVELHFRVVEKQEFEDLAKATGFKVVALYGDYACSTFDEATSPFMIWVLQKP